MIEIIVPGIPVSKLRARITRRGFAYTPRKTAVFENRVALCACRRRPNTPFDCALSVDITFYFPKPKSRKKYPYPSVKPDIENCTKSVIDALEGMIYTNDSRIVDLNIRKRYGDPKTIIKIEKMI